MISDYSSLSNVPYLTANKKVFTVIPYPDMFQVTSVGGRILDEDLFADRPTRGKITRFSKRSRKRMMEAMAKHSFSKSPKFVTLTFTDEALQKMIPHLGSIKYALDLLQRRIQRHDSQLAHIWRIEWVDRKSGTLKGRIAPHFHLIIDGEVRDNKKFHEWLKDAWMEVLQNWCPNTRKPIVDYEIARSRKHAGYYVSKYVAKTDDIWQEIEQSGINLDCEPFHKHCSVMGKHWGKSDNWNESPGEGISLTWKQIIAFKRLIRGWQRRRNPRYARILAKIAPENGFSVFGFGLEQKGGDFVPEIIRILKWVVQNE